MSSRRKFIKATAAGVAGLTVAPNIMASGMQPVKNIRPIHAFTKCLQFLNYNEMAELLARNEFDGADLTVRPKGQILPENVKRDLPKAYKALRDAGISTNMIVTNISDPTHPDTKAILQTMGAIGIRYYRLGYLSYDSKKTIPENNYNGTRLFGSA